MTSIRYQGKTLKLLWHVNYILLAEQAKVCDEICIVRRSNRAKMSLYNTHTVSCFGRLKYAPRIWYRVLNRPSWFIIISYRVFALSSLFWPFLYAPLLTIWPANRQLDCNLFNLNNIQIVNYKHKSLDILQILIYRNGWKMVIWASSR